MTTPARAKNDEWVEDTANKQQDSDEDSNSCDLSDDRTYDYKFKICLLGESGVGKTSLIKRFVNNKFDDDSQLVNDNDEINFTRTKSTIGVDCVTKVVIMRGHKICLEIWDTAGQGMVVTKRF